MRENSAMNDELYNAVEKLRCAEIDGYNGLPENLFLLISGLIPIPNVDLLITNDKNQILLTKRNDDFFQKSWHIPGGCMRFGEEFEHRIQQTALNEIGSKVLVDLQPLAVKSVFRGRNENQLHANERGHTIAILFSCKVPKNYQIDNKDKNEEDNGYCKWFDYLPDDFMEIQKIYLDVLKPWIYKEKI